MSSANDTMDTHSSAGGSSVASDNTDARALSALKIGGSADADEGGDLYNSNKGVQEALFSTLFTLTKNRALDTSQRLAALRIIIEFLQLMRVIFNSMAWSINRNLWVFRAVEWLLFRVIIAPKGYATYVTVMYVLAGIVGLTVVTAAWVAIALKGDDTGNVWLRRLVFLLQLLALLTYSLFPYAILDVFSFMLDCSWGNISAGLPVFHLHFTEQRCLAMPHLVHMLFAGAMCIVFCGLMLVMSAAFCDMNPMTRGWLASPDAVASIKITTLKLALIVISAMLDAFGGVQAVLMLLLVAGVWAYHLAELPYYAPLINAVWTGLWTGLLLATSMLVALFFSRGAQTDSQRYAAKMTQALLYGIFPAVALGAAAAWARMRGLRRLTLKLRAAYEERREAAATACSAADHQAREDGASLVSLMTNLRTVHRFRDVRQVSLACRAMRVWDEDGLPDAAATEYGEFVIKCGMARLPGTPTLLVMYANFLIEVPKDGQAARTQMQLAAKATPGVMDAYNIFVTQQLAKLLKRDGDGMDLLGYVEFQRNYRACVRAHKLALMAQRQFWNALLRDAVPFKDLQRTVDSMEATEQRATATYRRVLERYPTNGKLLKVWGRYLEFVRNDPGTAARYYEEAVRQGTAESMLAMTAGQGGTDGLAAMGALNERVDGLIIINAQGVILMVNAASLDMFGYDKGELEGKNVSTLMPPPFSTHHDNFLKRFVDTGSPHIVGVPRAMVALQKNRSMFPVLLCATRLSGVGADMLFLGVMRRGSPVTGVDGSRVVRFWMTPNGTVMCADDECAGCIGKSAADLTGICFSSLSTEPEAVVRFLSAAVRSDDTGQQSGDSGSGVRLRTHLLHAYLPPVEVELTAELGGALDKLSDCRTVITHARMLSEEAAVMVLDHKGHLLFATDKLAALLGHPVSALVKMELSALLPQPYCQIHGTWFKNLSHKPGPVSCRAGGVVHLVAANGTRVAVTLQLSARDDPATGRMTHIIIVNRASEAQRQDQQRLLLTLNHAGTVLSARDATPRALFGFSPGELVGRPLAAVVDVFGLWRRQHGEDGSLLALLAETAASGGGVGAPVEGSGAVGASTLAQSDHTWRVGVHLPVPQDGDIVLHAAQLAAGAGLESSGADAVHASQAGSNLLYALQARHRLRAARMSLTVLEVDEDVLNCADAAAAASMPVLQVALHRADALSSVLELDKNLTVLRADDAAGLMFGLPSSALLRMPFTRLVGLPPSTSREQLLGSEASSTGVSTAKKGAMKGGATGSSGSRIGFPRTLSARHLADGGTLPLEMQAVSYHQGGKGRLLVRLQLLDPASASLPAMQALREGKCAAADAAAQSLLREASRKPLPDHSGEHSRRSDSESADERRCQLPAVATDDELEPEPLPADSHKRTSQWVREASRLPTSDEAHPTNGDGSTHVPHGRIGRGGAGNLPLRSEAAPQPERRGPVWGGGDGGQGGGYTKGRGTSAAAAGTKLGSRLGGVQGGCDDGADDSEHGSQASGMTAPAGGAARGEATSAAGSASVGGDGDGGSEAGVSISSATGAGGHDEDLAIDARRSKRLKKLNRMLHSVTAQAASTRWRIHTLVLLVIMLTTHMACFAVLTQQVTSRYDNCKAVANMASALDKFQAISLRANFLQKCSLPQYQNESACSSAMMRTHLAKLAANIDLAHHYHRKLFLGEGKLKTFDDPHLLAYWGYKELPELIYMTNSSATNGSLHDGITINSTRTLWSMGNVLITAAQDVLFSATDLGADMEQSWAWQYVKMNAANSVFSGYAWSLDTYVDHVWHDLTKLSVVLIILLIVEAVVVQLACMLYEAVLVQATNVAHMRLFSVFLALPSATVRFMTASQLQVDDEGRDEQEEDELELAEGAAGATATGGGGSLAPGAAAAASAAVDNADAGEKIKPKSVRMVVVEAEDAEEAYASDDDEDDRPKRGGAGAREDRLPGRRRPSHGAGSDSFGAAAARRKAAAVPATKPKPTGLAALRKVVSKRLLGWLDPKFKLNGKRLMPSSAVLWRFLVPQLLWVATVAVIFGVSYVSLQGLQGPLASLDMSAHVLYRMSRCRLTSNALAFSTVAGENAVHRAELLEELSLLREAYSTLLYGGYMRLQANVSFEPMAPASAFAQSDISDIFFRTSNCLRHNQSLCITDPDHPLYEITHSGIDAMMNRYMDNMAAFAALPDELATPSHYAYEYAVKVGGTDLYESLNTASELFVRWMITRFESVRRLHIILLAISLVCTCLFLMLLYRPYAARLRRDSRTVAGLLSLLPAEVDVEGHVKTVVLGMSRGGGGASVASHMGGGAASAMLGGAQPPITPGATMQLQPWGAVPPGMMGGGPQPMNGGAQGLPPWSTAAAGSYGGTWMQQGPARAGSLV